MEAGPSHRPLTPDVTRLRDKPIQPAQPPHDSSVIMMFLRGSCAFPWASRRLRRCGAVIQGVFRTVKIFYWAEVFVKKEKDLPGPLRAPRAQSSPDGRRVHWRGPAWPTHVPRKWAGSLPPPLCSFPAGWDPRIPPC